MQTVNIPDLGIGDVDFPDDMSDAEITAAIRDRIIPSAEQEERNLAAHINKGGGLGAFKQAGWSAIGDAEDIW